MPINFKDQALTGNILENGFIHWGLQANFETVVPTDWQIVVIFYYETSTKGGQILVTSWVEQYTKDDELFIKYHQPTGTSFVDSELIAKLKKEEEEALRKAEYDKLQQQLNYSLTEQQKKQADLDAQKLLLEKQRKEQELQKAEQERLQQQLSQEATIKELVVSQKEYLMPPAQQNTFTLEIVIFFIAGGLCLFCCGVAVTMWILKKYQKDKDDIIKELREARSLDLVQINIISPDNSQLDFYGHEKGIENSKQKLNPEEQRGIFDKVKDPKEGAVNWSMADLEDDNKKLKKNKVKPKDEKTTAEEPITIGKTNIFAVIKDPQSRVEDDIYDQVKNEKW